MSLEGSSGTHQAETKKESSLISLSRRLFDGVKARFSGAQATTSQTAEAESSTVPPIESLEGVNPLEIEAARLEQELLAVGGPDLELFPLEARLSLENLLEYQQSEYQFFYQYLHAENSKPDLDPSAHPVEALKMKDGFALTVRDATIFGTQPLLPLQYIFAHLRYARKIFTLIDSKFRAEKPLLHDWATRRLKNAVVLTKDYIEKVQINAKVMTEINQGSHYLSHGIDAAAVGSVLTTGKLLARDRSLQEHGQVMINTTYGISSSDKVTQHTDGNFYLLRSDGSEKLIDGPQPMLDQLARRAVLESSEVCFADDSLYGGIGAISFVFPAREIMGKMIFYTNDGVHAFAPSYDPSSRETGFGLSLEDTPHVLIVRPEYEEQVMTMLRSAPWIQDAEAYIQGCVRVIAPPPNIGLPEAEIRTRWESFKVELDQVVREINGSGQQTDYSYLVPTGVTENSEKARSKQSHQLYKIV